MSTNSDATQTTVAGPIPTPEQRETWGEDYLWMWCAGHPKEAAAEIERLQARISELEAREREAQKVADVLSTMSRRLIYGRKLS